MRTHNEYRMNVGFHNSLEIVDTRTGRLSPIPDRGFLRAVVFHMRAGGMTQDCSFDIMVNNLDTGVDCVLAVTPIDEGFVAPVDGEVVLELGDVVQLQTNAETGGTPAASIGIIIRR